MNQFSYIDASELVTLENHQLLDVRLADDFEAEHILGAENNCVFEVAFADRLGTTAPNKALPTIVYGFDSGTHEAEMAAEKLNRFGYSDIRILSGGLDAARRAGVETVIGQPLPDPFPEPEGRMEIDLFS